MWNSKKKLFHFQNPDEINYPQKLTQIKTKQYERDMNELSL